MAAPPASVMNLRRLMRAPLSPKIAPYHNVVGNSHGRLAPLFADEAFEQQALPHRIDGRLSVGKGRSGKGQCQLGWNDVEA
jgi:hypothetical protein